MDFFDLQTALTLVVILTATAGIALFDYLRKHRRIERVQPIPSKIFEISPTDYSTVAKELAFKHSLEPLVGVATSSRPPVEPRAQRDTVTVELLRPQIDSVAPPETLPPFTIDAALWERLISSQPQRNLLSSPDSDFQTIQPTRHMIVDQLAAAELQLSGMIQPSVLDKWLESGQRFTGLVVSVGINDADSSMWHSHGLMQSVGAFLVGLLKAKDYCCRTSYDEFLLVCPGEQGAQSQRRLNHISERLWDYQLRGIGARSILFSWGGVQVQNQPLAEALASATERMRETKRPSLPAQSLAHRKAV